MQNLSKSLQAQIVRAITILKKGGVVAYPTDTVYGLGAAMSKLTAVERIFEIKGRPRGMALPLLVGDESQIGSITESVPASARKLAKTFFPGALTIILPKAKTVPDIITAGAPTIAFRVPNHPVPLALIKGLGEPIVGTSANLSGQPSALTIIDVQNQIGDKIDMIIDGSKCPGGIESTLVDLTTEKPLIRRQGAISIMELRKILPDIQLA